MSHVLFLPWNGNCHHIGTALFHWHTFNCKKYRNYSHSHQRQTLQLHDSILLCISNRGIIYNFNPTRREKERRECGVTGRRREKPSYKLFKFLVWKCSLYCAIKDFNFYVIDGGILLVVVLVMAAVAVLAISEPTSTVAMTLCEYRFHFCDDDDDWETI